MKKWVGAVFLFYLWSINSQAQVASLVPFHDQSKLLAKIQAASVQKIFGLDKDEDVLLFSRDGQSVAYFSYTKDKQFFVINGKPQKPYDVVQVRGARFNADGSRLAYVAERNHHKILVVNGEESKEYGGINRIRFSPDGKRLAYMASPSSGEGSVDKDILVVDGKEVAQHALSYAFSLDGQKLAYIQYEWNPPEDPKFDLYVDGRKVNQAPYVYMGSEFVFSADSKRLAYIAGEKGKGMFVVVDGKEGPRFDRVKDLHLSSDGARIAYVGEKGPEYGNNTQGAVVWDEKVQKAYPNIYRLTMDPKGSKIAYAANKKGQKMWEYFIVVNESETFGNPMMPGAIVFSSDGAHLAVVGNKTDGAFLRYTMFEDGKELGECLDDSWPVFSPNGQNVAFKVRSSHWIPGTWKEAIQVDSQESASKDYDKVWTPVFSPDGKSIGYNALKGNEVWWVVEKTFSK